MKAMWKKISLERIANGAIVLTALVAFGLLSFNYFARNAQPSIQDGLVRGDTFPQLSTKGYAGYPRTLLIVLSTDCEYCRASFPFYRRLVDAGREAHEPVHLVGVFPNKESDVKNYLGSNDLGIDMVPNISLATLKIGGTPSLILLNEKGVVRDFWVGRLSPEQELQVIKSVYGR
jgi:hypothetical protein